MKVFVLIFSMLLPYCIKYDNGVLQNLSSLDTPTVKPSIVLNTSKTIILATTTTASITMVANTNWNATTSAPTWCTLPIVSGTSGSKIVLTITTKVSEELNSRYCSITMRANGLSPSPVFTLIQLGINPTVEFYDGNTLNISNSAGSRIINIIGNTSWSAIIREDSFCSLEAITTTNNNINTQANCDSATYCSGGGVGMNSLLVRYVANTLETTAICVINFIGIDNVVYTISQEASL